MFEQTFVNMQVRTRRPWTVAVSLTLQLGLVAGVLIFPLFHLELIHAVPPTPVWTRLTPPPQPPAPSQQRSSPVARRVLGVTSFVGPTHVPAVISMVQDDAPEMLSAPGASVGNQLTGSSAIGAALVVPPPLAEPKPVVKKEPVPAVPVRVSQGAQSARLIFGPKPVYPPLAITARIQGTVKLQAVISRDGAIRNLTLVSGPPLLVSAAMAAVRQWRYQPTLLSSEPVEVLTDIDVNFTLSR